MIREEQYENKDLPHEKPAFQTERIRRLTEVLFPEDVLAVMINADPDSIASAMALKRLFWRKVKKIQIFHINAIKRADNLALIKLLKIDLKHARKLNSSQITKWAIVDSQPHHDEKFGRHPYDIIIDHHPPVVGTTGRFTDIRENYGANSTIMTEYLRAARIKPSPRLATALFYGIKTDTDNFIRPSIPNDIEAFRYLYSFVNTNIVKKIESSEITRKTLRSFKEAIDVILFHKDKAYIHMGKVSDPDILVIIADFFLKMAETTWCIVSGIYGQRLIVIFRNAGFRLDSGKAARKLFGHLGSAGGHQSAARAEILLQALPEKVHDLSQIKAFVWEKIKGM